MSAGALAILCGAGALPIEAARAVEAGGRKALLIGLSGSASRDIEAFDHAWIKLGEFGKLTRLLREREIVEIAMLGSVARPEFSDIKLDWGAVKRVAEIAKLFRGGDDSLLRGVARIFESEGFRFVGVAEIAPGLLCPQGLIAGRAPDDETQSDIALGARLIDQLAPFDVGQGAVVARARVIAIEAAEGTDSMLARVAELRASKRLRSKGGVFVKAAKRGQDFRFDLPAVGPATLEAAAAAGLSGVALAAGRTLILDRAALIAAAERLGLFVTGFSS